MRSDCSLLPSPPDTAPVTEAFVIRTSCIRHRLTRILGTIIVAGALRLAGADPTVPPDPRNENQIPDGRWRPVARFYSPADIGSQEGDPIKSVAFDPDGIPYVGTDNIYRLIAGVWAPVFPPGFAPEVRAMLISRKEMWLATGRGLMVINRETGKEILHVGSSEMWELQENDEMVVAASISEIWVIRKSDHKITQLPSWHDLRPELAKKRNQIIAYHYDSSVIISQDGYRPCEAAPHTFYTHNDFTVTKTELISGGIHFPHSIGSLIIPACALWEGKPVIATMLGGLFQLKESQVQPLPFTRDPFEIWSLAVSSSHELWVGGDLGVYVLLAEGRAGELGFKTESIVATDPLTAVDGKNGYLGGKRVGSALSILTDSQGRQWCGHFGHFWLNGKTFELPRYTAVSDIIALEDGRLLLNEQKILSILNPSDGSLSTVAEFSSHVNRLFRTSSGDFLDLLIDGSVYQITRDLKSVGKLIESGSGTSDFYEVAGTTYLAKKGEFVSLADPAKRLEGLNYTGGLSGTYDGENWWTLGTSAQGPRVYRSADGAHWIPMRLPRIFQIGFPVRISVVSGWIATPGGKNTMRFRKDQMLTASAPVAVPSQVIMNGKRVHDLGAWEHPQSIEVNWKSPPKDDYEPVVLERRLWPLVQDWQPVSTETQASFPGLKPGNYDFQIRPRQYGLVGEVSHAEFRVRHAWYDTWPAWASYGALGLCGLLSAQRWRTRRLMDRQIQLEAEIEKRTQELRHANAVKDEFLASINHEIRNPMNGIVGLTKMIAERASEPRDKFLVDTLAACNEQLQATLGDALDFAAIDSGELPLVSESFELTALVRSTCAAYDLPGSRLVAELSQPPLWLKGDPGKLRQILANLLSNALKYGLPPGARVTLHAAPAAAGWTSLRVQVTSLGPTLSEEELVEIFKPFSRGNRARETGTSGAGLGLSLSRKFARGMGGDVQAVSANGETTFALTLTLAGALPTSETTGASPVRGRRILAIEDEKYNRLVLGHYLAQLGAETSWASDIKSALALASQQSFDLILTDWYLPDGDGVSLITRLRAEARGLLPPIVVVSAFATHSKKAECLKAGATAFVSKPIRFEQLCSVLQNVDLLGTRPTTPGPTSLSSEALDLSILKRLNRDRDLGPEFADQLSSSRQELLRIWRTNREEATGLVHRIKGQVALLGAEACVSQLGLLEQALAESTSTPLLERLVRDAVTALTAIETEIRSRGDPRMT